MIAVKRYRKGLVLAMSAAMAVSVMTALSGLAGAEWENAGDGLCYRDDKTGERLTGWQDIRNGKYVYNESDKRLHALKGKYFFDESGIALTGWQDIDGYTYFFRRDTGEMVTSWSKSPKGRYYFGSDGVLRRGWKWINGGIYCFDGSGLMITGDRVIDGRTYSFDDEGRLTDPAYDEMTLNDFLRGISIGMTEKEARENTLLDLCSSRDGTLEFTSPFSDVPGKLSFDQNGQLYELTIYEPKLGTDELFAGGDWEFTDEIFAEYPHFYLTERLFLSKDGNMGAFYESAGEENCITIASREDTEQLWRSEGHYYGTPEKKLDEIFGKNK